MYEKEYIRKDGTVFPVELRTFLLRNEAGEPAGMWAIVRDITERKRADAALRVEGAALNAAANAVVITDREGRIEWVNPAFEALTGYSAEEALGKNPRDLVKSGKHDRAFYAGLWDTILGGDGLARRARQSPQGRLALPEEMTITPVPDESGGISHFVAIKSDVTERRRLEEQLRGGAEDGRHRAARGRRRARRQQRPGRDPRFCRAGPATGSTRSIRCSATSGRSFARWRDRPASRGSSWPSRAGRSSRPACWA